MLPSLARLTLLSAEGRVNDDAPFSTSALASWSLQSRPERWDNRENVLQAILRLGGNQLRYLPEDGLRDRAEFMLEAIYTRANSVTYASDRLKKDSRFMLRAIEYTNGSAFFFADDELLDDDSFIEEAFRRMGILADGQALPESWNADPSIMLRAVSNPNHAFMIDYADFPNVTGVLDQGSDGLPVYNADPSFEIYTFGKFFVAAMAKNANVFDRVSASAFEPEDREALIRMALRLNFNVYYKLEPNEQANPRYIAAAVENYGMMIKEIWRVTGELMEAFRDATIRAGIRQTGVALSVAPPVYRDDDAAVLEAVTQNGMALQFASERLRRTYPVVLAAARQSGNSLQFASAEMQNKMELVLAAARTGAYWMIRMLTEIRDDLVDDLDASKLRRMQSSLTRLKRVLRTFGDSVWHLIFGSLGPAESRLQVYKNYDSLLEDMIEHWRTQWTFASNVVTAEEKEAIETLYEEIHAILYQPRLFDADGQLIAHASPLYYQELRVFEDEMQLEDDDGNEDKVTRQIERDAAEAAPPRPAKRFKPPSPTGRSPGAAALMIAAHALPRWTIL